MLTEEIIVGSGEGKSSIIVQGVSFLCSSFIFENPLSFFISVKFISVFMQPLPVTVIIKGAKGVFTFSTSDTLLC